MDEIDFLEQLFPKLTKDQSVIVGPGDDCAAIAWSESHLQLLAVDQVVAEQHFTRDTAPERVGRKLLARNLSDIAAMGGTPRYALTTVAADESYSQDYHDRVMGGILSLAKDFNLHVIGGDISGLPQGYNATLTIIGEVAVDQVVLRSTAQVGDAVFATGKFGDSFLSEHHLDFFPRVKEGQWLAENSFATAMLDVSDGVLMDLGRIAKASSVDILLDVKQIPPRRTGLALKNILADGEDYELIFTVSSLRKDELLKHWPFKTEITCIGEVLKAGIGIIFDAEDQDLRRQVDVFSHFKD